MNQIKVGMAGRTVTDFYSTSNSSTVIARLRAGDFLVANGSTSGTVTIQFADQSTGQLKTGVVKGITLTKVSNES